MSRVNFVSPEILEPTSDWVLIGRGHFGDVFKTKHKGLHLHVAVKQLKDPSCCLEELLDEAQKIKHASDNYYVIQVLGIMKAPPCIVMQWMEYGCLGTLMERVSGIPWPFKYRILHEVALGMNWLHSLSPPLLHLDLKPRNVLLNEALHIRIADFGLSRFSSTALDDTKPVGGTWAYMPPEAFEEGYKPSKSTDIYSFAILSAVVLNGDDPYPVDVSSLIRISIKEGQRPTFESLEDKKNSVKNLDKAIAFTKRCWDNDKQKRPSFGECCNKWEIIKSAYTEKEIKHAVKTVQNMMDCTDSASSAPDVQQSASVPNTKDMSDIINKMKTIHIAEQPSAKQEAACSVERCQPVQRLPPANQPRANVAYNGPHSSYIRTGTQPIRNPQSIPNQRGWPQEQVHLPRPVLRGQSQPNYRGPDHRTNSSYYYKTGNFRYPPTVQRPYMNTARQPYQPRTPSNFPGFEVFETPFFKPGIQSPMPQNIYDFQVPQQPQNASVFNIAINNNTGPFQIGDNCDMSIGVPRQRQNTNQSGWTRPPSGPKPTQFSNIQMSGNTGPVQIGDNNSMYLEDSNQYIGSNIYSSPQHPVQTASSRSFVPANIVQNPQPMRSSQVSLPTEDGGPLSYTGHPTPETGRQTDQPAERPTIQDTTVSNSLEAKEKDNMSSVNSPSAQ